MPSTKPQISFTPEEDIKLCELVRQHPAIFNAEHMYYKNQGVPENIWRKISEDMNKSLDDCRRRWKNMKDTYQKHKRNRKLGTWSATKNKPSKWALYDVLSFLDIVSCERECLSSMQLGTEKDNSIEEHAEVESFDITPSTSDIYVDPISVQTENILGQHKRKDDTEKKLEKRPNKKGKQSDELLAMFKNGSEERKRIFDSIINVEEEDPIDAFFKSMALTVKTFPTNLKIRAKREVFNIITELECEQSRIDSASSSQSVREMYNIPTHPYVPPAVEHTQKLEYYTL